jgi:hypothetical protein
MQSSLLLIYALAFVLRALKHREREGKVPKLEDGDQESRKPFWLVLTVLMRSYFYIMHACV